MRTRTAVFALATFCLVAASASAQISIVADTFSRPDSPSLGATEQGNVPWVAIPRNGAPSATAAPTIKGNTLSFVSSTDASANTNAADVGLGAMQAYLSGYAVQDFTLTVDVRVVSSVPNEDQWMGVVWRKSQAAGSTSDGYLFLIRPSGAWSFLAGGVIRQSGTTIPLATASHQLKIVAKGNRHTITLDMTMQLLDYTDTTAAYPNAGYMSLATFHADTTTGVGTFERTFDNLNCKDNKVFAVNEAPYMAHPDDMLDDGPAIRSAIRDAIVAGPGSTVLLGTGTYRASPDGTTGRAFSVLNANGLTIKGTSGTVVIVTDPVTAGFYFNNSPQCALKSITLDYDPVPFTQGRVVATAPDPNRQTGTFDVQLDAGYPALIDPPFKAGTSTFGMIFDPATRLLKADTPDALQVASWTMLAPGLYRLTPTANSQSMVGLIATNDLFVYLARTYANAVFFAFSDYGTIEDVTVRAASSLAFGFYGGTNHVLNRVAVRFPPGSNRLITTDADGVHAQQTRVGPRVTNSFFEGLADDVFNIYSFANLISVVNSTTDITMTGPTVVRANDRLQIWDATTGIVRAETTAATVASCGTNCYRVTLAAAVSGMRAGTTAANADAVYDLSASGEGYYIASNTMQASRRYGVWVEAGNGTVENNTITTVGGHGILVGNEADWITGPLGPLAANVVVRNNVVSNVGYTAYYKGGGIKVAATKLGYKLAGGYPLRNITLQGNQVTGWPDIGIFCGAAQTVQVTNNRVEYDPAHPSYVLDACSGVTETFTAAAQFAGVENQDQWRYQYWNGTTYTDMAYQATPPDSAYPYWSGPAAYLRVFAGVMHPGPPGLDAVRVWVAPSVGTATITGVVQKADNGGGDGVNAKILHNGTIVFDQNVYNNTAGATVNVPRNVTIGDVVYFRLNALANNGYDATTWNPTVTFARAPSTTYSASAQLSATQGQNQWYYQQWNGSAYTNLFGFDAALQRWYGAGGSYPYIWSTGVHPGGTGADAVRTWIAPGAGTIRITGTVKKADLGGGDGVRAQVLHNTALLFDQDVLNTNPAGVAVDIVRQVATGDAIYFRVNQKANLGWDATTWDPSITFWAQ